MTIAAELKGVTKTFNGITALDNIDLRILEGEILALLGPNGSGKTTLLKILALIQRPTKGKIYLDNVEIMDNNIEQKRLETTMVFQKTVLFNTTVRNNVAYGLKMRKKPKDKISEEISNALKLVSLEGFEERQAKKLSGGEQQRVALARALVLNTKLLLLDEPTANLDPKNASIIEEVIATINRESKTTIAVATHNMFQAKNLPNRIALMTNGKVTEVGTSSEIFGSLSKSLTSFAALENTFTGTAETAENGTTLVDIGNDVRIETSTRGYGRVPVFISPKDIILSKRRFESSARNVFKGRIVEISDLGSVVRLRVDVGKTFTVQITKRSFNEMELGLNMEIFLAFKASSVQIV